MNQIFSKVVVPSAASSLAPYQQISQKKILNYSHSFCGKSYLKLRVSRKSCSLWSYPKPPEIGLAPVDRIRHCTKIHAIYTELCQSMLDSCILYTTLWKIPWRKFKAVWPKLLLWAALKGKCCPTPPPFPNILAPCTEISPIQSNARSESYWNPIKAESIEDLFWS